MDIIIAILRELFGGGAQQRSQPRRQVRGPGKPDGEEPSQADFEAMVRQMLGGPAEEERQEEVAAPPPPPPEAAERPRRAARQAKRQVDKAYEQARGTLHPSLPVPEVTPMRTQFEETASILSTPLSSTHAVVLPDFVRRLRNSPEAAREAFVYAEIFGPPVADKTGDPW